jgi:flagellar biosynthesis chaperone FliJ
VSRGLAALLRLRQLEMEAARRAMAEAVGAELSAEQRLAQTRDAPLAEAALLAGDGLDGLQSFAAWLPHATAAVQSAAAALDEASRAVARARASLGDRQAACKAAETLAGQAAARTRRQQLCREVQGLDDVIRGRRG